MNKKKNRLYLLIILSCLAGYVWLYFNVSANPENEIGVCIFKYITTIPCPSCGSTRSIVSLVQGNFVEALYWNPLGLIVVFIMVVSPVWIAYDFIARKETFLNFYKKAESTITKKSVAIPAILLIVTNWIWNIYKGL